MATTLSCCAWIPVLVYIIIMLLEYNVDYNDKRFFPIHLWKSVLWGSLRDREVACSASDRQGSNFESCVWRRVSSHSSHHPQEVLLAQFSLYVHKGGLKPDSFHFITTNQTSMCSLSYLPPWCSVVQRKKGGICLLFRLAVTTFPLCRAVLWLYHY